MRRLLLAAVPALALSCSGAGGTSNPPAPAPAVATSEQPAPADEGGAGFASPPAEELPRQAPSTEVPPEVSPELTAKIKRTFGENCRYERACGELMGVDCEAAVDGPYYYVRRDSLEVVSRCGGNCMRGDCTDCPPRAWTCATY